MRIFELCREQWVPGPIDRAFGFFSDAANLETITPPWVGFRFLTPLPIQMGAGTRLEYRLRLAGLPIHWVTHIERWEPPHFFVDVQTSGPYALWEHTHILQPLGDGVLVTDRVRYALPLGPLGRLAHGLAVHSLLGRIFDYRYRVIREHFDAPIREGDDGLPERADGEPGVRGAGDGSAPGDVDRAP